MRTRTGLVYVLPKLVRGGSEHFAAIPALLAEMAREVDIRVIAEVGDPDVHIEGVECIEVLSTRPTRLKHLRLAGAVWRAHRAGYRTWFVRISRVSALVAGLLCRLTGGRMFFWHSGAIVYDPWRSAAHLRDWLASGLPTRLAIRLAHRLATGPAAMRAFYVEHHGVPEHKILILPNDVDIRRFTPADAATRAAARTALGLPAGPVAMVLHRLSPIRRHASYLPAMLEALRSNPDWTLAFVGDGPERSDLEATVRTAGLQDRVRFLGAMPHDRVHEALQAADVFLNPSYVEGFPRVVIEAMASGLPVVTTDAGGTRDLLPVEHRDSVVPRDAPERFGVALSRMLSASAEERAALGAAMRAHARQFATDRVAAQYLDALALRAGAAGDALAPTR